MGSAFRELGRLAEAVTCFRTALAHRPNYVDARFNLGLTLDDMDQLEEAIACFRATIALRPEHVDAHTNLGVALKDFGQLDEATAHCRRAVELDSNSAEAHCHLGTVLWDQGLFDEAIFHFRLAITLKADCAEAHTNLGVALLFAGDYPNGWREYDWRFKRRRGHAPRPMPQPTWTGQDLRGRTLLVWGEQGIGDELIFFALLPELQERGARLAVECDPRLVAPLTRSLPDIEVVARQTPPAPRLMEGDIDYQIAAGSVAALLRPTREDFPPLSPYLRPDADLVTELRKRYGVDQGAPLVGLSWWSRADRAGLRSFSLAQWRPILQVPGLRFVSLQYGDHRDEIAAICRELGIEIIHDERIDPMADIDQALAQIAAMDQIVSMDNSTVHFAAMLGRPALMLVPQVTTWRAGMTGDSSPWIPNVTLFRQQTQGDWGAVIDQVVETLGQWASNKGGDKR